MDAHRKNRGAIFESGVHEEGRRLQRHVLFSGHEVARQGSESLLLLGGVGSRSEANHSKRGKVGRLHGSRLESAIESSLCKCGGNPNAERFHLKGDFKIWRKRSDDDLVTVNDVPISFNDLDDSFLDQLDAEMMRKDWLDNPEALETFNDWINLENKVIYARGCTTLRKLRATTPYG